MLNNFILNAPAYGRDKIFRTHLAHYPVTAPETAAYRPVFRLQLYPPVTRPVCQLNPPGIFLFLKFLPIGYNRQRLNASHRW
jgi:hypothetical protein